MKKIIAKSYDYKFIFALPFLFMATQVYAENNTVLLQPESDGYRSSSDPIQISLGKALAKDARQYLHLEVDAIDVTEYVSVAGSKLSYIPQEKLSSGMHQIRLVAILPDGNIDELASWNIEVRASATFVDANIQSNLDLQVSQRVSDDFTNSTIDKTQGQGSYVFSSNHSTKEYRITSNADFIYNSQLNQTQNNREFDVNEFNLKSEWSNASVTLGHQTMPTSSLVLTDFNRRGVSASVHTKSNNFEVTGFSLRTETITGFRDGLGIGKEDRRSSGAFVRMSPNTSAPEKMIVTAVYLDGKGSSVGDASQGDDVLISEGDASAVIVESYLNKKRLYLRGEYANTSYDFDGANSGYEAEKDHAGSLYVQYATERNEERTEPDNWNVGFLHQRIGQWFYSLGNANLPSDKKMNQVISAYTSDTWQLNANAAFNESNVKSDPTIPTIEARSITTNLTYTPQQNVNAAEAEGFSSVSYTLSYTQGRSQQVTTPVGFLGDTIDSKNNELGLAVMLSGDGWNVGVSHSISKEEDITNVYSDIENHLSSMEANFPINKNVSLTPVIQSRSSRDKDTSVTTDGYNAGLTLQFSNNKNLSANVSYSTDRERASDGSVDTRTGLYEVVTTWIQQEASNNKFGYSYFARASKQDTETLETNENNYQIFIGFNLTWPATI